VGALREPGQWRILVSDNGIGIDPAAHQRIFGMFQRLHSRHAYDGTGIGLAICERVVHRLGGQIGVDSTPGQGASFHFTVPDATGQTGSAEP
jgi:signal transduction histidine kinase